MINQPTDNDGADDDGEGAVQPQQETATTIANAGAHSEDEGSQTSFHSAHSDEHDSIDDESEEEVEVRRMIPPAAPPVITGSPNNSATNSRDHGRRSRVAQGKTLDTSGSGIYAYFGDADAFKSAGFYGAV